MKKIIFLTICLFLFSLVNINSQSLAGKKIFINPGHGGHDSNDREIPLGNGIAYWESEGNLTKGLYLKSMLENLGATVIMSRVTNTSADDYQPTSQIAAMASASNADYFHSIHSNATGTSSRANYTLILFQGRTSVPTYAGSLTMANFMVDQINKVNRTVNKMVAGDFDFYGSGQPWLGVFIGLNMPGTLSEGSFHDYTPETWRLKNDSYLKHEAWAIARSFLQYFNGGTFAQGIVAGIVRDQLELVPTSYSPLTNNERYKPINNVNVKLEPGNRTYTGDSFNNGYFFFDNVTPGNYKVIVNITTMKPDTANVTVTANQSIFSDRFLILNPILDPPQILSYSPADSLSEVSNVSPVVVNFDIRMNSIETQNAFSITPSVEGTFKWDIDFKQLTFTPNRSYETGGRYTVRISKTAKSFFGINPTQDKIFRFTTRSKLKILSLYPRVNETNVSTTVMMRIIFDKGINPTTLIQKISLTDSLGNLIGITANPAKYTIGIIEIDPNVPLKNNSLYRLTVREGIGDVEYVTLKETSTIEYKTEKLYTFIGNILDGFEQDYSWNSPLSSPNTTGVNANVTRFDIMSERKKGGERSGRLEYSFTGSNGNIELTKPGTFNLGEASDAAFGIWVFGDNSKNILEYKFIRQNSNEVKVKVDTINWTGWKLKKIILNEIPGSGTIQFKSINIVQAQSGSTTGSIFFDDLTSSIVSNVKNNSAIPLAFHLEQNYPNPFNPTTVISYQLSRDSYVSLKVYDILGKEIATLVDEFKPAGIYHSTFNIQHLSLSSGIFFYRMTAGSFSDVKKFVILK